MNVSFTPSSSYMIYLMINDVLQLIHVHLFLVMHLEIFREIWNVLVIQFSGDDILNVNANHQN